MATLLFWISLILMLLATAGFITFIIKQQKTIYTWSYRILLIGFVFQTILLGYQYYLMGIAPVISLKSALSFFAWTVIGSYLVLHLKFRLMVLGSFITPFAACLMIISSTIPNIDVVIKPMFKSLWLTIHIGTIFTGNGLFAITFVAAIMYLIQEYNIKKKRWGAFYSRLPSLQTLDSINHLALMYGFPFLTVGMISGAIYAQYALGSYWRWDPKEVWSLITWLFYAALLHERLVMDWRGRKAAIMSIIAFIVLLFSFTGASLWLSDYHSFKALEGHAG